MSSPDVNWPATKARARSVSPQTVPSAKVIELRSIVPKEREYPSRIRILPPSPAPGAVSLILTIMSSACRRIETEAALMSLNTMLSSEEPDSMMSWPSPRA
ncbi:hypothetical protein D9M68_806180 [compost metagenome]